MKIKQTEKVGTFPKFKRSHKSRKKINPDKFKEDLSDEHKKRKAKNDKK